LRVKNTMANGIPEYAETLADWRSLHNGNFYHQHGATQAVRYMGAVQ
jgi:hypothetical protein